MRSIFFLLLTAFGLCGCFHQAYYVSPFNGMTGPYRTVPLHSDSVKAASYLNAVLFTGQANDAGRDRKLAFGLDLSRSHNFGNFQAHYGLGITAGSYQMARYDSFGNSSSVNYRAINERSGNYFFGGGNVDGGINFVLPGRNSEWRVVGVETSLRREFGNFLDLRKNLPDSAATLIIRDRFFGTAGIYTEVLGHVSENSIIGVKMAYGSALGSDYHDPNGFRNNNYATGLRFHYFNIVAHYTQNQFTLYFQSGVAAKANHVSLGLNFRLGKH